MKPAAHCAVPGSKKVERTSLPLGRIEKMVPTEILFSRLADPSSGSNATQNGASTFRISGSAASSERIAATGAFRNARRSISSAATSISFCRSPSGLMPPFCPVMPASGPSAISEARSMATVAMASITSPTAAPCGVSDADRSRCERSVTRSSMDVSLCPLYWGSSRIPPFRQSAAPRKRHLPN
jgi:hypothetical protein